MTQTCKLSPGRKLARTTVGLAALLLPVMAIAPAWSQDNGPEFTVTVEVGGTYDSNITVEQLDVQTSVGDFMAKFDLGFEFTNSFGEGGNFNLGYDFSQSLHDDFTNFDIQSHTLSAGIRNKFGGATIALDYSFIYMKLGGNKFLNMHIINPNISGFVAKNVYLRGAYSYFRKDFETATTRDSDTHVLGVDAFFFYNQSKSYFSIGASYENENAVGDPFDLSGFTLKMALQMPIMSIHEDSRLRFSYAYRDRNYDNITPSIGVIRSETRSTFAVRYRVPVYKQVRLEGEYKYRDRNSNFPSSNYTENVISFNLSYEF